MNTFFSHISGFLRRYGFDLCLAVLMGLFLAGLSWKATSLVPPVILDENRFDLWFQADAPRIFLQFTDRFSFHHVRTNTHPLFSILTYPFVLLIQKGLNLNPIDAVRFFTAGIAFVWMALLYVFMRVCGCRRLDTFLLSLLAAMSASAMFWFAVPESFGLGSITILLALLTAVVSQHRKLADAWFVVINILTLAVSTTNWMAGILATFVCRKFRHFISILMYAFCIVTILWAVQKFFFPYARFFLDLGGETSFIVKPGIMTVLNAVQSFFVHSMIMPAIDLARSPDGVVMKDWPSIMTTQLSPAASATLWGRLALLLWLGLVVIGIWSLFKGKADLKLRWVLGLTLLGQLALHTVYGSETFLYSLHFIILLILMVALSTLTKYRSMVLIGVAILIPLVAANNSIQFHRALDFFNHYGNPWDRVLVQKNFRPLDSWSQNNAHVVLGYPGSRETDKAYLEAGGSFSPSVNSFGVSFWLTKKDGSIIQTSDNVSEKKIQRDWVDVPDQPIPGILTKTDTYQAAWLPAGPGRWQLYVKQEKTTEDLMLHLVVRSFGPAGGPVYDLEWKDDRLWINKRWLVTFNVSPLRISVGNEKKPGWKNPSDGPLQWSGDPQGWGYARLTIPAATNLSGLIEDQKPHEALPFYVESTKPEIKLDLPDKQFVACLNAQTAHIMMGISGMETRAADPLSYPLAWQRESAIITTALARAGKKDIAKQLSRSLAEVDYQGPLGTEGDAPATAVWALLQIANRLDEPQFDAYIWPHVVRKIQELTKMRTTKIPVFRENQGEVSPGHRMELISWVTLAAEPAKLGLIIGKADDQFPILYINAIAYRAYMDAAELADRLGYDDQAKNWHADAASLKDAWEDAYTFLDKEPKEFIRSIASRWTEEESMASNINNPRTYASGLWPTYVALGQEKYFEDLKKRWQKRHDEEDLLKYAPVKTSLTLAEAHQWLLLGDYKKVWGTLRWFWKYQASPDLYYWGEGTTDVYNIFDNWQNVRGWVDRYDVIPFYTTSAEMLMLQLDMLTFLDERGEEPVVVIGAGIPPAWLDAPMSVEGMVLKNQTVSWRWDGKLMHVTINGEAADIRLGAAFPKSTKIVMTHNP